MTFPHSAFSSSALLPRLPAAWPTRRASLPSCARRAQVEVAQVNAPYRPAWAGRIKGLRALFRLVPSCWRCGVAAGGLICSRDGQLGLVLAPVRGPGGVDRWLRGTPVVVNTAVVKPMPS